jgi:integrase
MLAPHWNGFIDWMERRGYRRYSIYRSIEVALPFAAFAMEKGIRDASALTDRMVGQYLMLGRTRDGDRYLRHVVRYLRDCGVLREKPAVRRSGTWPLLTEYCSYLRDHRGVSARTVTRHGSCVASLMKQIPALRKPETASALTPAGVHGFIVRHARRLSRPGRKSMCAAVRGFLRFLLVRGYSPRDIVSCVPVIPTYKLDRLPRVIDRDDIQKILRVVDRSTAVGRRDYAMFLLLATYGVRVGQLCALRLDDIDWRRRRIRIRAAKGGKDTVLPLRTSVGEAIIAYLRHGRPSSLCREVFLRVRAPIRPMRTIAAQIRPYARKAGVGRPFGPHAWRHACATRILAEEGSLKTIRDVLGHRSIESAFIYTKVDLDALRRVALEWPAESA